MPLLRSYIKDGKNLYRHYFLCPYLPLGAGEDSVSKSLLRFKQRLQPDLDQWIGLGVDSLRTIAPGAGTVILRPLRHDETIVREAFPGALDLLARALALEFGCRYLPELLTKTRPTLPNKFLTRRQRRMELEDVYRLTLPATGDGCISADTPFLLIDDILTTGTTMRTLIHILQGTFPLSPIRAFTLTRAANTV